MDRGQAQGTDIHAGAGQRRFDRREITAPSASLGSSDRRDHADRPVLEAPERERDRPGRRRIQPLGVIDRQDQRAVGDHLVEQ